MRTSRRELVKRVPASGIALSMSRLASAQEPPFAARETLPGRGSWNPAATGMGRIDGVPKVTRAKLMRCWNRCRPSRAGPATGCRCTGYIKYHEAVRDVILADPRRYLVAKVDRDQEGMRK